LTGRQIGNSDEWDRIAHYNYYVIFNVAVGGRFPGPPNGNTVSGYDSSMRIQYVGVYESD